MTELTEPDNPAARPAPEWPQDATRDAGQDINDPQVAHAMARLLTVPPLPVAEHETIYNELHDELLAALNSEPIDQVRAAADRSGGEA